MFRGREASAVIKEPAAGKVGWLDNTSKVWKTILLIPAWFVGGSQSCNKYIYIFLVSPRIFQDLVKLVLGRRDPKSLMPVVFNMGSTECRGRELVCWKVSEGDMRLGIFRDGEPQTFLRFLKYIKS